MIVEPGRFHWREERMSLPGFAAEASLSRTGQVYRGYVSAGAVSSAGTVQMALPKWGFGPTDGQCCCDRGSGSGSEQVCVDCPEGGSNCACGCSDGTPLCACSVPSLSWSFF